MLEMAEQGATASRDRPARHQDRRWWEHVLAGGAEMAPAVLVALAEPGEFPRVFSIERLLRSALYFALSVVLDRADRVAREG
jgi:hypothetical protein